jgi:hypothetical protein
MEDLERRIANSASPGQSHLESMLPLKATSRPNLNQQPHPYPQGLTAEATVHMLQEPPAEWPASYDHYNQDERVMLTQQCTAIFEFRFPRVHSESNSLTLSQIALGYVRTSCGSWLVYNIVTGDARSARCCPKTKRNES